MEELKIKLDNLLSKIAKTKMTSKEYDEMSAIDSVINLGIPGLDVSLIRELIEASYSYQKQVLSNKKIIEASNRDYMNSDVIDFTNDLNKSQKHLADVRNYYESLLDEATKELKMKEK